MIPLQLRRHLEPLAQRRHTVMRWASMALCWALAALVGTVALVMDAQGAKALPLVLLLGTLPALGTWLWFKRGHPDGRKLVSSIEARFPELDGRLLTALDLDPGDTGTLSYLQLRVLRECVDHSRHSDWASRLPFMWEKAARSLHAAALSAFVLAVGGLGLRGGLTWGETDVARQVTVTPGDVTMERGESLVVMARFNHHEPARADLVLTRPGEQEQRIPLVKSLADPLFGVSVPGVDRDLQYRVEFDDRRTRDFVVGVFAYPRLERADAEITYPEYTALSPKRIDDTRRVSAVQGSLLNLSLRLNKPVARASLVPQDRADAEIPLAVGPTGPRATLTGLLLDESQTFHLALTDEQGRTNQSPARFTVRVYPNRRPELKIASPRGDSRPSPLEEVTFEGTVWDDFGVHRYGLAYSIAGDPPTLIALGEGVPSREKMSYRHVLALEDLSVESDELISWYLWADDTGPDGQPRRTLGDLYFAEVRPFDEIFREGQAQAGGQPQERQGEPGAAGGGQAGELTDQLKEIINATWKLQRETGRPQPRTSDPEPSTSTPPHSPPAQRFGDVALLAVLRAMGGGAGAGVNGIPAGTPLLRCGHTTNSWTHSAVCSDAAASRWREDRQLATTSARHFGARVSSLHPRARALAAIQRTTPGLFAQIIRPSPAPFRNPSVSEAATDIDPDIQVLLDAQALALATAREAREKQEDPRAAAKWDDVVSLLESALEQLHQAHQSPAAFQEANAAQKAAYQALLRLQEHEYSIAQRNQQQSESNSRRQQMQNQLNQLELTQSENRYETERQATAPQSQERREALQVMSRLRELARRQQDLNQRFQELQTALLAAETENQREEIRRELKRLQEEEQRMLRDVDELQQRMDRPENQSRTSEQQQQLDRTRQDIQRAAEAAKQGEASQALAAGTRAQRRMQEMRKEMRRENAGEFAEEMRQMREEARELARRQEQIRDQLEETTGERGRSLSEGAASGETQAELADQAQRLSRLLDEMTEISRQSEDAEPLMSQELYDSLRKYSQDDQGAAQQLQQALIEQGLMTRDLYQRIQELRKGSDARVLNMTSEFLREGYLHQARQAEGRTRAGIEGLREGIERAAERVLGNETGALRLAGEQLDQLAEELNEEIQQSEAQPTPRQEPGEDEAPSRNQQAEAEGEGGEGERDASSSINLEEFVERGGLREGGPITGGGFGGWSDRLREVEELVDDPALRGDLARTRERARLFRQTYRREGDRPDWAEIRLEVLGPLLEVRSAITEELARREPGDKLVPLDRDAVPSRYQELVRRYYEALGNDE